MNVKSAVSAILAVSLAASGVAFAQGNSGRDGRDRNDNASRRGEQERRDGDRFRHDNRREGQEDRRDGRGAGPGHSFYRGDRLPMEYRHRQYVVDDWRGYNLSAPPRGYHWVQTGGDFVLVAIATGIIAQLLLGR